MNGSIPANRMKNGSRSRPSKLPPRLAKQREHNRLSYSRNGSGGPDSDHASGGSQGLNSNLQSQQATSNASSYSASNTVPTDSLTNSSKAVPFSKY